MPFHYGSTINKQNGNTKAISVRLYEIYPSKGGRRESGSPQGTL